MGDLTVGIRLRAFAKVNYALEVRGLREDGYHEIASVLQSVSLADDLDISRLRGGFALHLVPSGAVAGPLEENTVYRAWSLLREASGRELPARILLRKNIPAGAGLGGGSADAAATLCGLDELFGLGLNQSELRDLGVRIGADVPFCLTGGTALGEGIGEDLTPLPAPPEHHLVLAKSYRSADTGGIYRAYDERRTTSATSAALVVAALRSGDLLSLANAVGNDLEPVTVDFLPEVETLRKELLELGALAAAMSGSGSAVYGIFGTEAEAEIAREGGGAPFVGVCKPVSRGVVRL